jgi:hypothetical protein
VALASIYYLCKKGENSMACNSITVSVVRCDNKDPIHIFNVSDMNGFIGTHNIATDNIFIFPYKCPGYKFTVGAVGYIATEYTLTGQELDAQFAEVCLKLDTTITDPHPPSCPFSAVLVGEGQPEGAAKGALDLYRLIRDHIGSTSIGRQLVRRYYEDTVQSAIKEALNQDRQLAWDMLVLLIEIQPLIISLLQPTAFERSCRREPVLDATLAKHLMEFGDKLNQATKEAFVADLKQIKALIQQGIGHTPGELFLLLESSTDANKEK